MLMMFGVFAYGKVYMTYIDGFVYVHVCLRVLQPACVGLQAQVLRLIPGSQVLMDFA